MSKFIKVPLEGKKTASILAKMLLKQHMDITPEVRKNAKEMFERLDKGERITKELAQVIDPLHQSLRKTELNPRTLMNPMGTNFQLSELADAYAQYVRNFLKSKNNVKKLPDSPVEWVFSSAQGNALKLLQELCGPDFRKRVKKLTKIENARFVPLAHPFHTKLLTDNKFNELSKELKKYEVLLHDRLDAVLHSPLVRTDFSVGLLKILQGNIGEILALENVFPRLEQIRKKQRGGSNINIYLGAKWRTPGGKKQLASDMIIGEIKGGSFKTYLQVEVKTGRAGEFYGLSQAYHNTQARFKKTGSHLVFDSGTMVVTNPGEIRPFTLFKGKEEKFYYGYDGYPRAVTNFNHADRLIIYAKGRKPSNNLAGLLPGKYETEALSLSYQELQSVLVHEAKWFKVGEKNR